MAEMAKRRKPKFDTLVNEIGKQFGGEVYHGPSKLAPRIAEKLTDVKGDFSQIKDAVRSSIVVTDVARAREIANALKRKFGKVTLKDTFDEPSATGYRDLKVWIDFGDSKGEIALHIPEMFQVKETTHALYSKWRTSKEAVLQRQMLKVHSEAWRRYEVRQRTSGGHLKEKRP